MHLAEDQTAFFHAEYPRLAGYCGSGVGDPDLGHDLACEVLLRVLARWSRVDEPRRFAYRVATNLITDEIRRSVTRRRTVARLRLERPRSVPEPDRTVRDLVERLPERLRQVVLLHYYADLALDDVALTLNEPAGTVRRWASEARALLRQNLQEQS